MTPQPEVVDVEISIGTPSAPDLLGVYLYHPDPDGRAEAEARVHSAGAEYTTYPIGPVPPVVEGYVQIKSTGVYIAIGSMYVISPPLVKLTEVQHMKTALVYFTTWPYRSSDTEEKVWLAAQVPLAFPERRTDVESRPAPG